MVITAKKFGADIGLTAKIARLGYSIYEVPISYRGRTYPRGRKTRFSHGLAALWYIFKFHLFCDLKYLLVKLPADIQKPGNLVVNPTHE